MTQSTMMTFCRLVAIFFLSMALFSCGPAEKPVYQVLVFSKTNGYRHASIEAGVAAIRQLGAANGFTVEATEDSTYFTEDRLKNFAAVVFLNTSGDVLNNWQQADFQRFIEAGGGYVGIHGAAASEYDWKWYGQLVGAVFNDHPAIQTAKLKVLEQNHPATASLPATWQHTEEWYNFRPGLPGDKVMVNIPPSLAGGSVGPRDTSNWRNRNVPAQVAWTYDSREPFLPKNTQVLLAVDESSYQGGTHGLSHPISWVQEYEGGRSFYTALGHDADCYSDSLFLKHLLGGFQYAIGEGTLDYSKAKTQRIPPPDRFVRTVLASNLDEPMELEVFPDGTVMVVERKGAIKIYDPKKDTIETVCILPVYHDFEEGIMGVGLDPNWKENRWIYIYYSLYDSLPRPQFIKEGSYHRGRRNRLSRFVFDNNMLHLSTEKMLLEVPEVVGCCHTGGSIAFDGSGHLFLSTGDNTNPFESDGFAPIDERPGRALWDAQKSSANPNDLRGKILRITPLPNGTYAIPEGNLFPPGTPGTRPEIYVMGCRNPFRISVDKETGCLYWGDVGPDAGKDGKKQGPKGYDTVNRACEPGNHGWPLFRGNHIYYDYHFGKKANVGLFDPDNPINNSPNNTGKKELPPVKAPLIWYSYDESIEFPWVATGGKNPMAGPVFHQSDFDSATISRHSSFVFPEYFENKLFIYEWMRNWVFVVTMDEEGKFVQADPFLPNEKFSRPMDLEFGPDGALYMLEYGQQWFAANPDARLNKIEYAPSNRKPVARLEATPTVGADPLKVRFSAAESVDYDGDALQYEWVFENGYRSNLPAFEYTFELPGKYPVTLYVSDPSGAKSRAKTEITVGNNEPSIAWHLGGNQTFYWDETEVPYSLEVADPEDGSLANGTLDTRRVKVSIDYLAEGKDVAAIVLGHQTKEMAAGSLQFAGGAILIQKSDCGTCHAVDRKINGPSFIDIANRYYGSEFALQSLSEKVIKGGAGNWGETAMSAHPNISKKDAESIVKYILSLAGEVQGSANIPFTGSYLANAHLKKKEKGAYVFQASYRDLGSRGAATLSAKETVVLRYPKIEAEEFFQASKGVRKRRYSNSDTLLVTDLMDGRFIAFENLDLTGVDSIQLGFFEPENVLPGCTVEVRLDGPEGALAGKTTWATTQENYVVPLTATKGKHDVYLLFKNEKAKGKEVGWLDWVFFGRKAGKVPAKSSPVSTK